MSTLDYYELQINDEARWHLATLTKFDDNTDVDIWAYNKCSIVSNPKNVPFYVYEDGSHVDYNPTAFSAIIISQRLADILDRICPDDYQRIAVSIKNEIGNWYVANILNCIECIDHSKSTIQYYPQYHAEFPGKPRGVVRLVLDNTQIVNHHIFHVKDWKVAIVISETLKAEFETAGISGVEFTKITYK